MVRRFNSFHSGNGFNFQQLVDHYDNIKKLWAEYCAANSISADKVGGSSAYEVLLRSWLVDIQEDKIFTSFPFYRELRTFVNEAS